MHLATCILDRARESIMAERRIDMGYTDRERERSTETEDVANPVGARRPSGRHGGTSVQHTARGSSHEYIAR